MNLVHYGKFTWLRHGHCKCRWARWLPNKKTLLNTFRPIQNGRHFADDIFKGISLNENVRISLKIPLKFVPRVRINNIPSLVQIMTWYRPGDKPLCEPVMIELLTHICVTRPQWDWTQWLTFCKRYFQIHHRIRMQISIKFVLECPIDNESSLA